MANIEPVLKLIRLEEVEQLTGCSKSHIYALIKKGEFPSPIKLSRRKALWNNQLVNNWIKGKLESHIVAA